jgi:DNA (cytosine-5)-methyltransferase 1
MRVGSLFAGIGGFDLGLERAGYEIAWQVENDPYCDRVLAKHWPGVTRYGDIREIDWRTDDCLDDLEASGYEIAPPLEIPACAVGAPHVRRRLFFVAHLATGQWETVKRGESDRVLPPDVPDTRSSGWRTRWTAQSARQRIAETICGSCDADPNSQQEDGPLAPDGPSATVADTPMFRAQGLTNRQGPLESRGDRRRQTESGLGRGIDGLPDGMVFPAPRGAKQYDWEPPRTTQVTKDRAARVKALGNAVVPQVVEVIGRAIMEAEFATMTVEPTSTETTR